MVKKEIVISSELVNEFKKSFKDNKDIWIGNYWDNWLGIGPQRIRGTLVLGIRFGEDGIAFGIPRIEYDWHPAKETYDI